MDINHTLLWIIAIISFVGLVALEIVFPTNNLIKILGKDINLFP
jgi:hypothetical protein